MHVVLFDEELTWKNLLPLTFTRPVSEIRIGILTIKEKWDKSLSTLADSHPELPETSSGQVVSGSLNGLCSYLTQPYLSKKFGGDLSGEAIFINSKLCPGAGLISAITALKAGQALYKGKTLLAFYGSKEQLTQTASFQRTEFSEPLLEINNVWDIFQKNAEALNKDFELVTKGRTSQPLSATVTVIGDKNLIFLEEGAKAEACILNTTTGPIYIGKEAEIMEGSVVRGPLAVCEHSTLKLSTKVYGATTVGPYSKIGGEVSNSVIIGYSNKGHDGFLGNSVLGEWCNLGADTNNSNLKNNYGSVKLFNYNLGKQVDTGLQFCGLIMGDHSKSGINTMFNTGTVVGVASNIYGAGFPATHVPSFSWGGSQGFELYLLNKLFETASRMYARRDLVFGEVDKEILTAVFDADNAD